MAQDARVPPLLGGRYRCERLLKSGSGIETFAAVDLEAGTPVIVKRVVDAATMERACVRLAHEAEVLRRLESTSFGPPITTGREEGSFYLVRPMVEGVALDARLATGPLKIASALRVGINLLEALELAHDHRVLHRDVKPANVIVDEGEPISRAVLIDFGLARSPTLDSSVRDERVGTARAYLAPEAAGVLEREVDERSDLYTFGVVLFECVTGRPPFEGEDVGSLLRQHLNATPPSVREVRPDVPRVIDAVVQRLLRKDPAERYQSAGAVLADFPRAIDEALRRGVPDPVIVVGAHDNRPVLTEPAFVGRTAELALLSHAAEYAADGDGGVVLLEAESGGGKSRLLDELAVHVGSGAWVLRGQGVDQGAQRPFQVLEGLVHEINDAARANPAVAQAIRAAVGDRADAAVAALPELAATFEIDDNVNLGPEAYGETRSISALSVLLHALGETGRPAVVLLDDCQWADASTLKLLAQWPTDLPCKTIVIAAFRTEEVPLNHALRRGRPIAHVSLQAFGEADVESLAESMAGKLPAAAIEAVAALSEGSPFMAAAVLRGLVETGALVHEERGWRVDPARLADVQTSRRAALFLVRRLELLSPTTLELLTVGAILGKDFDAELARELCDQDAETMQAALDEAAQRRIVWPAEISGHARFLHDKLREALLSRLGPDERAALHLRAATRIEEIDPDRIFELAYHFDAARRDDLALPYALRAAESARAQHSLDVALTNYRIAAGALRDDADGARAEVAESLGDVLTLDGAYDEATAQLTSALEHASTADRRAALLGKLGEVAFKKGDQRSARAHLEAAVRELRGRLPKHSVTLLCALVIEVLVQTAHTVARLFLHRKKLAGSERRFLLARLYSRLAYCYWFNAGKVACMWAHLREMNILESYPPTAELAQAYSEEAPAMTIAPWFSRGIRYVEKSLQIRTDLGDLWGQGQSLNFYGVVLYASSRYREAIEKLDEAYRLLDQTGDRWEANVALWNKAYALYRLGELSECVRVGRRLHETATAMGDMTAAGGGLSAWSRTSNGQVPEALLRTQLDYGLEDAQTDAEVNVAEGLRRMADGDHAGAVTAIEQAASIVRAASLRQEYVSPVQPWLATALREQAEAAVEWDLVERRDALRRGRKAVRAAVRLAFFFRNNYPHALREAALYAAIAGRRRRAQRLMARSLDIAESQGAAYERLLTLRAWATMGLPVMGTPANVALESAESELALLVPHLSTLEAEQIAGPAASLSLLDRFSALLAAGREIAAASSVDAVLIAVQRASVALLRGDQCEVLPVTDRTGDALFAGEGQRRVSRMMVRRAIEERSVVAMSAIDDEVVDSSDSIELSGVRSALCAPILSEGAVLAVLYVSHAGFDGLFGDDEVTIAEFIATLAGAALEHVANTEAELRKMLDDLTVTSSLLEATLDATIDGILVVDLEGRMTSYNRRFGEMWDIPPDVLSSRNDKEAIRYVLDRLVDPAAFVAKIEELYADVEAESYDTLDFKDGRVFERGSKPQRIGSRVVGRVWSFRDVTERVRVEQALAVARDKAMEASRLKSEFVATTSHEIRTPMNGVIGLTGLLLETELDDVQREYAEAVRLSAEALLGVINDILDFSKIEAGKLELEDVDFDLTSALDDVSSLVARGAAVKRLELLWHCDADVPNGLRGDVGRLRQILLNLLANAVKFTERGGVSVHVANVGVSDPARARLRFEVIDTGVGLAPEDRDRLFEPFSQADASTTRRFGGTGLGLAICSRLAEAMGGRIGVKSEFGVGSTFWIEIPFTVVDAPAGRTEGRLSPPLPLHQNGQPGVTGRVLVAEDNAINQLVAKEMIRRLGYECDVVGNGAEALEALRLRRYAAVLMDCYMPEMDGFVATRELHAREHADGGVRTPVIAMTALAMAEDRERCTESGMDDYVSKPVNLAALGSTLERWISNRTAATA